MELEIKLKQLNPEAVLPSYAHLGDVGLDMRSLEDYILVPGEKRLFMCGWALEFSVGYGAFVMDKGSVGVSGIKTLGGVFDAGYRGEYNVCLVNLSKEPFEIKKGQKIAQLVILPVAIGQIKIVEELSQTSRGEGKFGSTGKY